MSSENEELCLEPERFYMLLLACGFGAAHAKTGEEQANFMNLGAAIVKASEIAKANGHTEFVITSR